VGRKYRGSPSLHITHAYAFARALACDILNAIRTAQYVGDAYGDCGVTSLIIDCGRLAIYG